MGLLTTAKPTSLMPGYTFGSYEVYMGNLVCQALAILRKPVQYHEFFLINFNRPYISQACAKRIEGDESGHKHCTGQYFDYWHCIDKCVALKLFAKLK
nr:uncharacterized protein LOC104102845 [Ipomoea trifida]GMC85358.1 cytochrome B-C1 complex subunit 6-like [Ipomoea batatas]GMD91623.1 cytochrome B-C1 complex subunit 6-like [Ipomoea batatas]GMD92855.1 cytochrome B-C1 complex subunit 6-like [Ipomoea batatas]GME12636.1 cytochrome B-C1 complex subunit 6-like [Ipomoea batatas]